MGRNKDKVIIKKEGVYIFRGEGTLTPPGLTMHAAFEGWFLDWAREHRYILLLDGDLQKERGHIPESVIYKADYVFTQNGNELLKYNGGRWMKSIGIQKEEDPTYHMFFRFVSERYNNFVFMSHEKDSQIRGSMNKFKNWKPFFIEEWKDTALFMKQLMWDQGDYAENLYQV